MEYLSRSDKILLAINELEKKRKKEGKITKEMMVVRVWEMYPSDFCMQGYPEYPNADISKYITRLFKENLLTGGFNDYRITEKGRIYVKEISFLKHRIPSKKLSKSFRGSRYIGIELTRIMNSKVFKYFRNNKDGELLQSDLFDFLGTSPRSFISSNKSAFIARYNLITREVIPFCKTKIKVDKDAKLIVELWDRLHNQFKYLMEKKK